MFSYGSGGRLERITDSLGRTIIVEVDREGRLLSLVLVKPKPEKRPSAAELPLRQGR